LGDVIMDCYVYCSPLSGNIEAAALCLKFERKADFVGGVGIVAAHMKKLGAQMKLTTVLGDDAAKDFLLQRMSENGVEFDAVIDPSRVTTRKQMFIEGAHRSLLVETADNRPISPGSSAS